MKLRALTLNMWHGLDGNSSIHMGQLEPLGRRERRLTSTIASLKDSGADVVCLQEVNPAPILSKELSEKLGLTQIHTIDNGGLRLGNWGLPPPLFCGITTLADSNLNLNFLGEYQLSGPAISYASDFFCFRLKETRMVLFGMLEESPWGRVLIGNYHLHHGVELTGTLKSKLNDLYRDKIVSEIELKGAFDFCYAARDRRLRELDNLKNQIDRLCKEFRTDNILLAGDLNCSDESLEWKKVISWGFVDCHSKVNGSEGGFTWNSRLNTENHRYGQNFHFPWPIEQITEKVEAREQLRQAFLENEFRLRRIDYLFARGPISQAIRSTNLFAEKPDSHGMYISDHFGVITDFQV